MQNKGAFPTRMATLYGSSSVYLPLHSVHLSRIKQAHQQQTAQVASDRTVDGPGKPRGPTLPPREPPGSWP